MVRSMENTAIKRSPEPEHLTRADFLWLLGSLCQLHRLPFDPLLIERQFPPPCSIATLRTALDALDFKVGTLELLSAKASLSNLPLPAIGFLINESETTPEGESSCRQEPALTLKPILVIKTDGERFLYFRAGSQAPETATFDKISEIFAQEIILVSRAAAEKTDAEAPFEETGEAKKFGFRWFIPELLKHKRIWREVLVASLVIQLIGLATPLFTQVVIDKVVVHQTHRQVPAARVAEHGADQLAAGLARTEQEHRHPLAPRY